MQNIFFYFNKLLYTTVSQQFHDIELKESKVYFDRPPSHISSDLSTSIALSLAKKLHKNPMDVAGVLQEKLQQHQNIKNVEILKPGFINIDINDQLLYQLEHTILSNRDNFGFPPILKNNLCHVEYISANPTGPLHVGHVRGAIIGQCLSNLLEHLGGNVIREYYVNDAGGQIDALGLSMLCYLRYVQDKDVSHIENATYKGQYMEDLAINLHNILQTENKNPEESLDFIVEWTLEHILNIIKEELTFLKIKQNFASQNALIHSDALDEGFKILQDQGYIYNGTLAKPKGQDDPEWEERKQWLFKSSAFGDDSDRALKKSDGSWTYFSSDVGYHYSKLQQYQPNLILVVLGADHAGYAKRLAAVVKALSAKMVKHEVQFVIKISQLVRLIKDGQTVRMSKRAGNVITLKDLYNSVGSDAIYFMMMMRKNDAVLDFDLNKAVKQSSENPLFYVQYASARCCSVLNMAKKMFGDSIEQDIYTDIDQYVNQNNFHKNPYSSHERDLILTLSYWPQLVSIMYNRLELHMTTYYLIELAGKFHALWNAGKSNDYLRFVVPNDKKQTVERLKLVMCVYYVIFLGLDILSIESVKELR